MLRYSLGLIPLSLLVACSSTPPEPPYIDPISTNNAIDLKLSANSMAAGGTVTATITTLGNTATQCASSTIPVVAGPTPPVGAPTTLVPVAVTGTASPFSLTGTLAGSYSVTVPLVGVILTGNAEPGAIVTATGGTAPVTTRADHYSGRFQLSVCLTPSSANKLSVTAKDDNGTSHPTTVEIDAPSATVPQTLEVTPSDPMPPNLQIQAASATPPGAQVAVATADQQLVYAYSVTDQYGNQIPNGSVTVTSNMPGSSAGAVDTQYSDAASNVWYQGDLVGFTHSGTWTIAAHVAGTTQTTTKTVVVNPDPSTLAAVLSLSPNITQVGNPLNYQVRVVDAFGNADDSALSRLSFSFSPSPTTAPSCLPGTCAAPTPTITKGTGAGTIEFATPGILEVTASFSGTPAVIPASQFVSVIDAPVPPVLDILSPVSSDVLATNAGVPIQVRVGFAHATNNTVTVIASGGVNTSSVVSNVGQDVCNPLPGTPPIPLSTCPAIYTLDVSRVLDAVNQTVMIVATDGTTGATMTKSVTFQVNPIKNVIAAGGRSVVAVAQGGAFVSPMGLTTYGVTGDLYVADSGANTVYQFGLASTFPVTPAAANVLSSGFTSPSDVRLRPSASALGTYPPATYQGLYVGTSNFNAFTTINATNTTITQLGLVSNVRTSSYSPPVNLVASVPGVLFAARPGARVLALDPVTGADLTGAGGLLFNGNLQEPWGVTFAVNGTSSIRVFAAADGDDTVRVCDIGGDVPTTWQNACDTNEGIVNNSGASRLSIPRAVAFSPSGKLYVVSLGQGEVLSYDLSTLACSGAGCGCSQALCGETAVVTGFNRPNGIAFDGAGNMYVSDERFRMVAQIAPGATPF